MITSAGVRAENPTLAYLHTRCNPLPNHRYNSHPPSQPLSPSYLFAHRSDQRFFNDLFVPFGFLMFNGFDFLGRMLSGIFPINNDKKKLKGFLTLGCAVRVVFFPLFLLCNVSGTQLTVAFDNDFFPIAFMSIFAVSNGYISSLCMMLGPQLVPPEEQELAGNVMIFFLSAGLMAGSALSFVDLKIATDEW